MIVLHSQIQLILLARLLAFQYTSKFIFIRTKRPIQIVYQLIYCLLRKIHWKKFSLALYTVNAIDILNAIQTRNMENLVPNVVIDFRIMLTTPVPVASGERSFSKLKLIKTYLRNAMKQDRLNELTIISI